MKRKTVKKSMKNERTLCVCVQSKKNEDICIKKQHLDTFIYSNVAVFNIFPRACRATYFAPRTTVHFPIPFGHLSLTGSLVNEKPFPSTSMASMELPVQRKKMIGSCFNHSIHSLFRFCINK